MDRNIKKIVSAGCSFIHGSELGDEVPYSQLTYPALTAKHLGVEYNCVAYPSASNQGIAKQILESKADWQSFYIVQWTYPSRFGVHLNQLIKGKNNQPTTWLDLAPNSWDYDIKAFHEYREYSQQLNEIGIPELSKKIYTYVGHKQYMFQTELCMRAVKGYLESQGAQYVFLPACDDVAELTMHSFEGKGFIEWCSDKNFPVGKHKHPLHEAHQEACTLLKDMLNI